MQILKIALAILERGRKGAHPAKTHAKRALFAELSVRAYLCVCCLGAFACKSAVKNNKRKTRRPPFIGVRRGLANTRLGKKQKPSRRRNEGRRGARKTARGVARPPSRIKTLSAFACQRRIAFILTVDKPDRLKKSFPAQAE